jgi:hypothetical protein
LRNEANIAWMRDTFAQAQKRGDLGVVFAMQADTFYATGKEADSTGFKSWLAAFQEEVIRWNKPVLLIQGDTHVLKIDHPMTTADGARVDQLTRVVVQGGLQKIWWWLMYEPISRAIPLWSDKFLYRRDAEFYRIGKLCDFYYVGMKA